MTFSHFEHRADIGVKGTGKTLAESFEESAKAMFEVMTNIKKIKPTKKIEFEVTAENEVELLINFLNQALGEADAEQMFLSKFKVTISTDGMLALSAIAWGSPITAKTEVRTEVKAATLSQAKVEKKAGKFIAQCIVDV
ncbi:archease [Candidatus Woesearchaeota archaeon]|jgi:SHS2 domain-containing protein|nr:archease [Candidatus Woesearchaeota archaeon]MBT7062991.1 archease [Candidatus Woesearchaeota archaeon]MBT7402808.1 archease [Candidatus Woesearchaeota archaeon]